MPIFGEPNYTEGAVFVVAGTGAVAHTAAVDEWTIVTGATTGASGAVTVTLPAISTLFPLVAVQPSQAAIAASGAGGTGAPYYPTAAEVGGIAVKVTQEVVASGCPGVSVVLSTAEKTAGVLLNGGTGAYILPAGPSTASALFVAINGDWYVG